MPNHDAELFLKHMDKIKLAFDSYVEWELNGGKELLLGANRLTNRQLFWIALARSRYRKRSDLSNDFWFGADDYYDLNTFDSIKETFGCKAKSNLTTRVDPCSKNYNPVHRLKIFDD